MMSFVSKYFCGHMNAMGYLLTAHYFMTYIDWIIRHNVHDFRFVQFIGSDKIPFALGKEELLKNNSRKMTKRMPQKKKFL